MANTPIKDEILNINKKRESWNDKYADFYPIPNDVSDKNSSSGFFKPVAEDQLESMLKPSQFKAVRSLFFNVKSVWVDEYREYAPIWEYSVSVSNSGLVSVSMKYRYSQNCELGTALSALSTQYYLFMVGKRGSIKAASYPDSWKQFAGQRIHGGIYVEKH